MSDITGRCLCGSVTFAATSVEANHHACHCGMCRRWAGGPVLAARTEGLRFEGKENIAIYASSEWAERAFCMRCGSSLYYRLKPQDLYWVSIGAFDDSSPFRLVGEIYVDAKPKGYDFAGHHPRLTEAEFLAKLVPPESSAT